MLLVLALEATLGKGALADEVKGGLNFAAFCAFVYAFATVLACSIFFRWPVRAGAQRGLTPTRDR